MFKTFRQKHKKLTNLSLFFIIIACVGLLATCLRLRENYYTRVLPERSGAEKLLKTDACSNSTIRIQIGVYAQACIDAEEMLSISAYEKALILTMYDMIPCQHGSCHYIFGEITKYFLFTIGGVFVILFLYSKLKSTNNQASQLTHLPLLINTPSPMISKKNIKDKIYEIDYHSQSPSSTLLIGGHNNNNNSRTNFKID